MHLLQDQLNHASSGIGENGGGANDGRGLTTGDNVARRENRVPGRGAARWISGL